MRMRSHTVMPGIWSSYIRLCATLLPSKCTSMCHLHVWRILICQWLSCIWCMWTCWLLHNTKYQSNILSLLRIWINTFCKPMFGYLHVFCLYSCGGIEGVSFYVSIVFVCVCVICELLASVNCACTEKDFFFHQRVFFVVAIYSHTLYIKVFLGFYFFLRQPMVYKLNNF